MFNLKTHGLVSASVFMKPFFPIVVLVAMSPVVSVIPGLTQSAPATNSVDSVPFTNVPSTDNEAGLVLEQVPGSSANEPAENQPTESEPTESAIVANPNGDRLTVRSGPSASYEIIGSLANGQTLQLSGRTLGNWTQLNGGGWVYIPYLQMPERTE